MKPPIKGFPAPCLLITLFAWWDSNKLPQQPVQAGAVLRFHSDKFDAHALAGVRVAHCGPSADLTARDFKHHLNALSDGGGLCGCDKYAAQS
jgi:hypothetical protein